MTAYQTGRLIFVVVSIGVVSSAIHEHCGSPSVPLRPAPAPASAPAPAPGTPGWRIVGGHSARRGSWPWQVALTFKDEQYCGGTIIDNQWILTAGHCFMGVQGLQNLEVLVGQHAKHRYEPYRRVHQVHSIYMHPKFPVLDVLRGGSALNDIGLIRLRDPIQFTDHVQPVCLPSSKRPGHFDGHQECWITGWGDTKDSGDSRYLQQVRVSTLSNNTECEQYWEGSIDDNNICAGRDMAGACGGDSGGPMVCKDGGKFYQVGITSFGTRQCRDKPSVFTRVSGLVPWIRQVIADPDSQPMRFGAS